MYARVVEASRDHGKVKQRTVADLGRKDLLAELVPKLKRLLGQDVGSETFEVNDPDILEASTWGPVLAVRALCDQLGLWAILDKALGQAKGVSFSDRAFVLIANRLIQPTREHGLAGWLETDLVCDRQGRRFLPHWHQHQRVRVDYFQNTKGLAAEQGIEGKYVLATSESPLSVVEIVAIYQELSDVERGFRQLKDILAMRPIDHPIKPRVKAQVLVAAFALLVQRLLHRRLEQAGIDFSAERAMQALSTPRLVSLRLDGQPERRGVSGSGPDARRVLKTLGVTELRPPAPPERQKP